MFFKSEFARSEENLKEAKDLADGEENRVKQAVKAEFSRFKGMPKIAMRKIGLNYHRSSLYSLRKAFLEFEQFDFSKVDFESLEGQG